MLPAIKSTGGIAFLLIVAVVAVGVSNLPSVDGAVREFTLVVHHQDVDATSMSGEVVTRLGTYVNETYPGPTLTVDLGDEVVIKVINEMPVSQATIHFHGQHQVDTYYMDGVPHVTQVCGDIVAVKYGSTFQIVTLINIPLFQHSFLQP